ncbi:MAG: nitroreductase [Deltaproteobacteria bacterium]|nr:nitroreductase [Deltaproteobacteria bacterium]
MASEYLPISELIKSRRSIRKFTSEPIDDAMIDQILTAGIWAPSGKNNQPWKFAVIKSEALRKLLAGLTHYTKIIENAPCCIAVFLDHNLSYDRTKDCQAIGACIQNMLLVIHDMGLGAVWLGEILRNKEKVAELLNPESSGLNAPSNLELMAVVALGHPAEKGGKGKRKALDEVMFLRR